MADGANRIRRSLVFRAAFLCLPSIAAGLLWGGTRHLTGLATVPVSIASLGPLPTIVPPPPPRSTVEKQLRSGETLGQALGSVGLTSAEVHAAVTELSRYVDPRRLRAGDIYRATYATATPPPQPDGSPIEAFEVRLAGRGEVRLARRDGGAGDGWSATFRAVERAARPRFVEGVLEQSLEQAVRAAGADPALAYVMADVLAWDLDFNRDLRRGDRFRVVFEEEYLDGVFHGVGRVTALVYESAGKRHEAFRFGERGYFDAAGRPLQKMFLRSPLKFSRVTSGFTHRRFHPVLKTYRPHWGVDFGAPTGTPVHVTAHGVVTAAGWDGGGGKVVKVRHPNGYLSCYLHLSRFANGVKPGSRVSQGEVIGYVGATGLATGAHLDYRVQLNGRWINPLQITNASAEQLSAADLTLFRGWAEEMRAGLDSGRAPDDLRPLAPVAGTVLAQVPVAGAGPLAPAGSPADAVAARR